MSKRERLDAIERRLAYLEANLAGEAPDPPEFSCRPQYEPDDDRLIREADEDRYRRLVYNQTPSTHPVHEWLNERGGEVVDAAEGHVRYPVPSDVRERVSERSNLADKFSDAAFQRDEAEAECRRYIVSLRALLAICDPSNRSGAYGRIADMHVMISACLDQGATITPSGLQRDE